MLKIKSSVDLKELEKIGFKKDMFMGYILEGYKVNDNWKGILCSIKDTTREIWISESKENEILKLLEGMYDE